MTIYGTPLKPCAWCVRWDLPCGPRVHDNVLARYVPLIETTNITAAQFADRAHDTYVAGEPVLRNSAAPTQSTESARLERAQRRADRISLVATIVLVLAAVAVTIGGYALAVHATFGDAPGCGTACVPTTYGVPGPTGGPVAP